MSLQYQQINFNAVDGYPVVTTNTDMQTYSEVQFPIKVNHDFIPLGITVSFINEETSGTATHLTELLPVHLESFAEDLVKEGFVPETVFSFPKELLSDLENLEAVQPATKGNYNISFPMIQTMRQIDIARQNISIMVKTITLWYYKA